MTGVEQIGIAVPAACRGLVSENPVDLVEIRHVQRQLTKRRVLKANGIECLLVLAKADIAHEPGIVEHDSLAT